METKQKIAERLKLVKRHVESGDVRVMILGLGSVGTYLLDYLISRSDESLTVIVVGRNREKMESDVNIVRVSALIRKSNRSNIIIESGVDFSCEDRVAECIRKYSPDFLVNSSRVYSGLKYGSISWSHVRAYGIWSPLAVGYIKHIMKGYEKAGGQGIVINTSYSDAIIPWLKTAGKCYPDFGSGNLNHLIPRIQFAAASRLGIKDFWNVEVQLATSHFHDVVISKEGQTEGVEQLIQITYKGREVSIMQDELFASCRIVMPSDAKRNMMNASSNYEIIASIIDAIRFKEKRVFFSPGAFGEVGGYPVWIDGAGEQPMAGIDTSAFTVEQMQKKNRESIYLDGIESVEHGILTYTDELIKKSQQAFGVTLPKSVPLEKSGETAELLIRDIIEGSR